jgi:hypothetical protein
MLLDISVYRDRSRRFEYVICSAVGDFNLISLENTLIHELAFVFRCLEDCAASSRESSFEFV